MPEKKLSNVSDQLAAERTFLAWVRTGIALMGFGFVIVKFALFVRQVSLALGSVPVTPGKGYSAIVGVVMVGFGALMTTLAYFRFRKISRQIEAQAFYPSKWLSALLTLAIITGALLLVFYLIPSIR